MHDEFQGPHFDSRLIGPNGKLTRLHEGAAPPPAQKPPPPVRETSRDVAQAKEDERRQVGQRQGYRQTLFGGEPVMESTTGKKTLLGQ
jgi:hypothetical protein